MVTSRVAPPPHKAGTTDSALGPGSVGRRVFHWTANRQCNDDQEQV